MSQPDPSPRRYGRERVCPQCGTRVAQKATTCFFCGAGLNDVPRPNRGVPWADLILFAVIGSVIAIWWLRPPTAPANVQVAQLGLPPTVATAQVTPEPQLLEAEAATATASATVEATVTPVLTPTPTSPAAPVRHVVKQGDTVAGIAAQYNSTIKDIIQANGLNANGQIGVGQELVIPIPGPMGGPGPTATPNKDTLVYTVQSGDTLSTIAERYNSRVDWILQANNIKPTDMLRIGQSLTIPRAPATATPALPTAVTTPQTATPSPIPTLRAPALLIPADGAILTGQNGVLLSWTSVGILKPDQWYVVTVRPGERNTPAITWWTKGTTWRLGPEYRTTAEGGMDFTWRVQVRNGAPDNPGEPATPASAERRFTWR